jgi:hypothetical protein
MAGKILISHRGNLEGSNPALENMPGYIQKTLDLGFDVEIDVWCKSNSWYLGHDRPDHIVDFDFFVNNKNNLWLHAKNVEAIEKLSITKLNWFWHQTDVVTLTSWGFVWAYPGNQPIKNSISVLPEIHDDPVDQCLGICSDYILDYFKCM